MNLCTDDLSEKQQAELKAEKQRILQDKSIAEEEKARLVKENEKKLVELRKQQDAKEKLAAKIDVSATHSVLEDHHVDLKFSIDLFFVFSVITLSSLLYFFCNVFSALANSTQISPCIHCFFDLFDPNNSFLSVAMAWDV